MAQIGNIGKILVSVVFAVFFTMLLVTANTMAQSVRERTNEIGVLKTLGFSASSSCADAREALFLTILGGPSASASRISRSVGLGADDEEHLPGLRDPESTIITSLVLMVALGVITGLWPAVMAMRLKIIDALRRG